MSPRVGKKGEVDGRLLQILESCVGAGHLFGQVGVLATEIGRPDVAPLAHEQLAPATRLGVRHGLGDRLRLHVKSLGCSCVALKSHGVNDIL